MTEPPSAGKAAATARVDGGRLALRGWGWRDHARADWTSAGLVLRSEVLLRVPQPRPGEFAWHREGRTRLGLLGVGARELFAFGFGHGGYRPPPGQRRVLAAILAGRFRFTRVGVAEPELGRGECQTGELLHTWVGPDQLGEARERLTRALRSAGAAADVRWRVAVAANEALTNAAKFSGGGYLTARLGPGGLEVSVGDRGRGVELGRLASVLLAPREARGIGRQQGYWLMLTHSDFCLVTSGPWGTTVRLRYGSIQTLPGGEPPTGPGKGGQTVEFQVMPSADGRHTVVICPGELDYQKADRFRELLQQCDTPAVTVDFTRVRLVDSTGVGALVEAIRKLQAAGVQVRVTNVVPEVYEILEVMGLVEVFGRRVIVAAGGAGAPVA